MRRKYSQKGKRMKQAKPEAKANDIQNKGIVILTAGDYYLWNDRWLFYCLLVITNSQIRRHNQSTNKVLNGIIAKMPPFSHLETGEEGKTAGRTMTGTLECKIQERQHQHEMRMDKRLIPVMQSLYHFLIWFSAMKRSENLAQL